MDSQRVDSGGDLPISGLRANTGQFSNDYVRKLMTEKLAEYELQLAEVQSMRQSGNANETAKQNAGETVARTSSEFSTENKKILMEFMELKIENLKNILGQNG